MQSTQKCLTFLLGRLSDAGKCPILVLFQDAGLTWNLAGPCRWATCTFRVYKLYNSYSSDSQGARCADMPIKRGLLPARTGKLANYGLSSASAQG